MTMKLATAIIILIISSVHTDVISKVKDSDDLDPVFIFSLYTAVITQEMLTYVDVYLVPTDPPIYAYDQDIDINATLIYDIDYNCGETEECLIVTENFRIDPIDGSLIFENKVGIWDHSISQITFLILAAQMDNPDRVAYANVTASFDILPTFPTGSNKCSFVHVDENSYVDDANGHLYCVAVHEYTDVGTGLCRFLLTGAASVLLSGTLHYYNALPSANNGNGSLLIGLHNTAPYTDIVDREHPNVNPTGTVTCVDIDGETAYVPITVRVVQENTQYPLFEHIGYSYIDVPEDLPPGIDFTTNLYGDPIFATDTDNNDLDPIASNLIEYEVDSNHTDLFQVLAVLDRQEHPKRFRAAIALKKNFDPSIRLYQFQLYAKNSVPNVRGEQVIQTTVSVALSV